MDVALVNEEVAAALFHCVYDKFAVLPTEVIDGLVRSIVPGEQTAAGGDIATVGEVLMVAVTALVTAQLVAAIVP